MRTLLRWLQPILALLAALFIVAFVAQQAPALRQIEWRLDAAWLALSALLMLAVWALEIRIWTALLQQLGGQLAYLQACRIWFLTAVVRYIPGNIWQPLSMTLYAQQQGVRPEITVTSIVLYQLVGLLAVGPIAAGYFWATGNWGLAMDAGGPGLATWPLLAAMVLPVLLFVLLPRLMVAVVNWLLVKAKRAPLDVAFGRGGLVLLILAGMANWLLWGATFAAFVYGISPLGLSELGRVAPHLVFAYPIAYAVGFLSILLPSGFGVREGALYLLLAPIITGPVATVAALAFRLWNVVGEVLLAIVAALVGRSAAQAPAQAADNGLASAPVAAPASAPAGVPAVAATVAAAEERAA